MQPTDHMLIKELYTILDFERTGPQVVATLKINPEHRIFSGHFPGNPVMPGVCMIQIVKELAQKAVGKPLFMTSGSNIKFMAIINPEINDTLTMQLDLAEGEDEIRVKNTTLFQEAPALKLSASFKILP